MQDIADIITQATAWDFESLESFAERNLVKVRRNGSLVILNYIDDIRNQDWNDFNRQCRGTIVDLDQKRSVARPFDKFFNLDSHPDTERNQLPLDKPFEVSRKYDGSMITVFVADRKIRFATRSAFDSPQATLAEREFLRLHHNVAQDAISPYTLVFEFISSSDPHIVPADGDSLILIGARSLDTNMMLPYAKVQELAQSQGFRAPEMVNQNLNGLFAQAENGRHERLEEGWVIRFETGLYLKLKTWQYLAQVQIRRLGLTRTQLVKTYCALDHDHWLKFVSTLPQQVMEPVLRYGASIQSEVDRFAAEIHAAYQGLSGIDSQKDFALAVRNQAPPEYWSLLFGLRAGKAIDADIRKRFAESMAAQMPGEPVTPEMLKEWAFEKND